MPRNRRHHVRIRCIGLTRSFRIVRSAFGSLFMSFVLQCASSKFRHLNEQCIALLKHVPERVRKKIPFCIAAIVSSADDAATHLGSLGTSSWSTSLSPALRPALGCSRHECVGVYAQIYALACVRRALVGLWQDSIPKLWMCKGGRQWD